MTQAAVLSAQGSPGVSTGFRNRIINGGMTIDQRNAGASVTPVGGQYSLDRWKSFISVSSKFTIQQNAGAVTPPAGFSSYLGVTSLSSYSVPATEYYTVSQMIEGNNISDFGFGSASAKSVTLSFWVRSSLTGTFGGSLSNNGEARTYVFTYSIPVANTWTYITTTIPGDTAGTWLTGTGLGMEVNFSLGVGSNFQQNAGSWVTTWAAQSSGCVNVVGTNGATFYITGVQLEAGTTATQFEFRDYGRELIMCQRYYETWENIGGAGGYTPAALGAAQSTTQSNHVYYFKVIKRSVPTMTYSALGDLTVLYNGGVSSSTLTALTALYTNLNCCQLQATVSGTPFVSYQFSYLTAFNNNTTAKLSWSSEL